MEFYFENVTAPDQKMLAEVERKLRLGHWIMLMIAVGYMLYAAHIIWVAYTEYVIAINWILWFFFYLIVAVCALCMPAFNAKRVLRRLQRLSCGQYVIVRQFGERITCQTPTSLSTLDYYNIKKVYSLKTCYVIRFMDNVAVMVLSREGFTKGSFEEFKQFLRYKRPDLKIPE